MLSPADHRLAVWTEAAAWSLLRKQSPAAQRLLVIAFDAAMRAGYPELAEVLRAKVLELNSKHQLSKSPTAAVAFQSEDFQKFVSSVKRQISFEEAERLVDVRPADDRLLLNSRLPIGPQLIRWIEASES